MYGYDPYYDDAMLPTRQLQSLRAIRGREVASMERFTYRPPEGSQTRRMHRAEQFFSYCGGPALITLDTGMEVAIFSDSELVSVLIDVDKSEAGVVACDEPVRSLENAHRVDVRDSVYSSDKMRAFLGKRIRSFRLLQVAGNPAFEGRPCQGGLVVIFEYGSELLFCHLLHDGTDDLGVITLDMMDPKLGYTVTEIPLNL